MLMVGIDQLRQLPETGIGEEAVGFGQSAHVAERMHLVAVIEPFALKTQRKIEIELLPRTVVVVEVDGDRNPVDTARQLHVVIGVGQFRVLHVRRGVQQADRHFGQPVLVGIIEKERILPVETQIADLVRRSVHLHKGGFAAVIGEEVADARLLPALQPEGVPVDVVENIVFVGIQHDHIVSVGPHLVGRFERIFSHQLQVGAAIAVEVGPLHDEIVAPVLIAVYEQTVVDRVPLQIAGFQVAVIVEPKHGNVVMGDRTDGIRLSVAVQVEVFRRESRRRRGQPESRDRIVRIPVGGSLFPGPHAGRQPGRGCQKAL